MCVHPSVCFSSPAGRLCHEPRPRRLLWNTSLQNLCVHWWADERSGGRLQKHLLLFSPAVSAQWHMTVCVQRTFQLSPIYFSFLICPHPPPQLANVLEIDLDLVKVGIHLLHNVSIVIYILKLCFSQEEGKVVDLGTIAPLSKSDTNKTG